MKLFSKIFLTLALLAIISGCVSVPAKSGFNDLATVGSKYTESMNSVIELASKSQIDAGTFDVLEEGSLDLRSANIDISRFPRLSEQEREREIAKINGNLFTRISGKLTKRNNADIDFLNTVSDFKKVNKKLSDYFALISNLANSSEPEELGNQINSTVTGITGLVNTLLSNKILNFEQSDKDRISNITKYVVDKKIRQVLAARVQNDSKTLRQTLEIQKKMLEVLGEKIVKDQKQINEFKSNKILAGDLIMVLRNLQSKDRIDTLISQRQKMLTTEANISLILNSSKLSKNLNESLEKLVNADKGYLLRLTAVANELDELDELIKSLK